MEMYRCVNCMGELTKEEKICHHCGYDVTGYTEPSNALRKDTILNGRYLVGRVLGQGGFGITYVGYDLKLDLKVAVKEYFPGNLAGRDGSGSGSLQWSFTGSERRSWEDNIGNFLSEARKMAKLDEIPGIVRVRDCFKENQTAYIVMDFAEGVTLSEYLKQKGRMDYVSCVKLLLPIMESLETVHEKGLVHRDISPDNLMVQNKDRELRVKLLDFGAAIDMGMEHSGKSQTVVKKGYSAPEQYMENGNVGGWSDVYAMAAVIYRCVTGTEIPESMERVMKAAPVEMGGISNKAAREVLANALALRTEERTGTMTEFKNALMGTLPGKKNGKKAVIAAAAAAAVLAVCAGAGWAFTAKPWLPKVEALGCTNSSLLQGSNYAVRDREYMYFTDEEWNLHVCPYDKADKAFYVYDTTVVDDESGFINIGKDKVYYFHDNAGNAEEADAILEMDFDGSGQKTLIEMDYCQYMQYARFSDGKEMLYYITENGDTEDGLVTLCRYNLASGKEERLLDEDIFWYNLDGRYIYYTTFEKGKLNSSGTQLKRAYLNGKNPELLNNEDSLMWGYIEDDTGYLFSLDSKRMELCDPDGTVRENSLGEAASAMFTGCSSYSNGWIYYSGLNSGEIRKIRPDGTGEETIYTGENVRMLSCVDSQLWFLTGIENENGAEGRNDHTYLMNDNGSNILSLGGYWLEGGLQYKVMDGEVILSNYTGSEDHVIVPEQFAEGVWKGQISPGFPENVDVCVNVDVSELTWEKTEDETGVILTAYSGEKTGEYTKLVFPGEIEGLPVVEIGKDFMRENEKIERVILPDSMQKLGEYAFYKCSSLRDVNLPEGFTSLASRSLSITAIRDITFPSTLNSFQSDSLYGLETMSVAEGNETYSLEDGVLYNNETKAVKLVMTTKEGEFVVPSGIKIIAYLAFYNSQLTSVILPQSIEHIYAYAFERSQKLQRVVISEGVEKLEKGAFLNCISLSDIIIPKSVKEIGARAFSGCSSLRTVTISRDCQVAEDAFEPGVQIQYYD